MSPSTHSADVSQIQTDTTEILVDLAATTAALAVVDTGVDALLVRVTEARMAELDAANLPADLDAVLADTDALDGRLTSTRAGYLDNLQDQGQLMGAQAFHMSASTTSSTWQSVAGASIVVPNWTEDTFTVVAYLPGGHVDNTATILALQLHGSTAGDATQTPARDQLDRRSLPAMARGGFEPNETVTLKFRSTDNVNTAYLSGSGVLMLYKEGG